MNHTNTHCLHKPSDPSHKSPQPDFNSDYKTHNNNQNENQSQAQTQNMVFRALKKEKVSGSSSSNPKIKKLKKKVIAAAADRMMENNNSKKKSTSSDAAKSKIFIRFHTKNNKNAEELTEDIEDHSSIAELMEDSIPKTWNLRPRKAVTKCPNANGGGAKTSGENKSHPNSSRPKLARSRNGGDIKSKKDKGKKKVKDKKPKFSITLTKREIEEDIFSMTGAKPSRRPKKRNKNMQKQLDCLFPGLRLS